MQHHLPPIEQSYSTKSSLTLQHSWNPVHAGASTQHSQIPLHGLKCIPLAGWQRGNACGWRRGSAPLRPRSPAPHRASWPSVPRRSNWRGQGCRCRRPLQALGHRGARRNNPGATLVSPLAGMGHPQPRARPWRVVRLHIHLHRDMKRMGTARGSEAVGGDPALWRALRTVVRQARVRGPACERTSAQAFGDSACGSVGFQFALRVTADHVADRLGPCLAGEVGKFYPPPPAILRTWQTCCTTPAARASGRASAHAAQ